MKERGIATLEASAVFTILLTILLGGAAAWDYADKIMAYREILNRSVYDSGVKALSLRTDRGGNSSVQVNRGDIEAYIEEVASNVETDVKRFIDATGNSDGSGYRVEAQYAIANLDTRTGRLSALSVNSHILTKGSLADIPEHARRETDLTESFTKLSVRTGENGASLLAVPTALLGTDSDGPRYTEFSVLVGVRAFASLHKGFAGYLNSIFENDEVVYEKKVISLRGEFE